VRVSARGKIGPLLALALSIALGASSTVHAQSVTTAEDLMAPPRVAPRPRMSLAIGMGASFDGTGFDPARTRALPTFLAMGGIGDGRASFGLFAYSTEASGRYRLPDMPVDRQGLDAMLVVRPMVLGGDAPPPLGYAARLARSLALELGIGLERDGRGPMTGSRFGVHTGAHIIVPLLAAGPRSEIGLRLGGRALFGLFVPRVGDTDVGNTAEVYAALNVTF
jgi:hypothetical protein